MKLSCLISAIAVLPATLAVKCNDIKRTPQTQPPTYVTGTITANLSQYESYEKTQLHLNKEIPELCEEAVRVSTFNIHRHKDLTNSSGNTEAIRTDLKNSAPTVVLFQEVSADTNGRKDFTKMLEELGYKYSHFASTTDAEFGNMIASKLPVKHIAQKDIGPKQTVLAVTVEGNEGKFTVVGTHLASDSANERKEQAKKVIEFLEKKVIPKDKNYILAGDMNDVIDSVAVKAFTDSKKLSEVFNSVKATPPNYTNWNGKAIDFIFSNPEFSKNLVGAYVYHTLSSDHLPIMVDIITTLPPAAGSWSKWWWITGGVLVIIIILGVVGFFMFGRRKGAILP